jgi:hydrogenase maturation protease
MALAIGIGSLLHRDDAAGRVASRLLGERVPSLDVREVLQLTPELAEDVAASDVVLFLDASLTARSVSLTEVRPGLAQPDGHAMDPASLLALAAAVYGRRPGRCVLVRIPAVRLELGEGLTRETGVFVAAAVELAQRWVTQH